MQAMFNKWRDKSRGLLFNMSRRLGETDGLKPASLRDKKEVQTSLNVSLPALKSLLPYETMDEEGFFINRNSVGFGFHFSPQAGADESLMKAMAELFKNKLPEGCDCTFMLYKHHYLAGDFRICHATYKSCALNFALRTRIKRFAKK